MYIYMYIYIYIHKEICVGSAIAPSTQHSYVYNYIYCGGNQIIVAAKLRVLKSYLYRSDITTNIPLSILD